MENTILNKSDLAMFTGTENWYRHSIARNILYTDGIKYLAEKASAYWLIDEIALNQLKPIIASTDFQVWTLTVDLEQLSGILTCDDGNNKIVFNKKILFTDFPLSEIRIFCTNNVILLPSEN